jgi:uncharacterized membrane protein
MERLSLQLQADVGWQLPVALMALIAAVLLTAGGLQLRRGRRIVAAGLLAASAGAAGLLALLAVLAARRYLRGDRRGAGVFALAGGVVAVFTAAAAALVAWAPQALPMAGLALQAAAATGALYASAYSRLGAARTAILLALRIAALAAVLLVLFKPALNWTVDPNSLKPPLAILVDRSGSMATADGADSPSRYSQAVSMLASQRGRIEEHFRPRWRCFARSFQTAPSLQAMEAMTASGEGTDATDIALAIRGAAAEGLPGAVPAILLFSDGIHNSDDSVAGAVAEAGVPVYALAVGSATAAARRNIRLVSVDSPLEAAKGAVSTVNVRVHLEQLPSCPVEVRLVSQDDGRVLDTRKVWTDKPSAVLPLELKWTPKDDLPAPAGDSGERVMKLTVAAQPNPAEAVTEDNSAPLHVLVTQPRIGVLYVEGSMRSEYKFLKRLLDGDSQVQLASLVRVSGNRFWAQGSINGRKIETVPRAEEDFEGLDVIILGDLDSSYLTAEGMSAIRGFVTKGGGLVMLGGHHSFGPGGYAGTDIEAVLPVLVGGRDQPQKTEAFLPQLTAAGTAHPIFEGLAERFPAPDRPAKPGARLSDLAGCVSVASAKPAAAVLAVHPSARNPAGPLVVLATQQSGAGRTAAFTADTTWRWEMAAQAGGSDGAYQRFWSQFIRYLAAAEAKTRTPRASALLRIDRACVDLGGAIKVLARVADENARPIAPSRVTCTLSEKDGGRGVAVPLAVKAGTVLLEGSCTPPRSGWHRLSLSAADSTGKAIASDELMLYVAARSTEIDRLAREDATLRTIAEQSGGRFAELSALPEVIDHLIERQKALAAPKAQGYTCKLHNFPALLAAFAVLLTAEWLLRRRWQLQ